MFVFGRNKWAKHSVQTSQNTNRWTNASVDFSLFVGFAEKKKHMA